MKKVLWVIDDDFAILEVLKNLLQEKEFEVVIISSLPIRYESYPKPDLILLDLNLSGEDASGFVKNLKTKAKVILVSGDSTIESKSESVGADGFISKPFSFENLIKKIEEIIST